VPLDFNNRILVSAGIKIIRGNAFNFGIKAIINESKKKHTYLKTSDLSFIIAPKINAAGRLSDMTIGIRCLLAENLNQASNFAKQLIKFNENRKLIESDMVLSAIEEMDDHKFKTAYSIVLANESWHQGVVGILASRLKEKYFRPTITFANFNNFLIKGSGRSIDSFHLRDALDLISKRYPSLIETFGGHAMAAGLTIKKDNFKKFGEIFELTCQELITPDLLNKTIEHDKSIESEDLNYSIAKIINEQVWGQSFPAPLFVDNFDVLNQEIIGEKHTKCLLRNNKNYQAIFFNNNQTLPDKIRVVYSIDANEFNGNKNLQIIIKNIVE
ncbi:MAG: single-stranded-DNA-specific exonuclease RecJ, partial [Nitrosomonadales bacterium]|nr:single-stranded-DNA-specific exonuclease RecJ [Nitrosomonadales bacterium]